MVRKGKTATPKVRRPQSELVAALARRYRFLTLSAAAFDDGDTDECYRMSVELRALLHYGSSAPLLHDLMVIKRLRFVDSCPVIAPGEQLMWGGGLTIFRSSSNEGGAVVPRCDIGDDLPFRERRYTDWWKHDRVVTSDDGRRYSRSFLVTHMANTDAAHTDRYLEGDYQALKPRDSGWRVTLADGSQSVVVSDVAAASMRQIAWEVIRTLEDQCAHWLPSA